MSDNGGTGTDPQQQPDHGGFFGQSGFFGQGDGLGRQPQQPSYGPSSDNGSYQQPAGSYPTSSPYGPGSTTPPSPYVHQNPHQAPGQQSPYGSQQPGSYPPPNGGSGLPPTGTAANSQPAPKRRGRAGVFVLSLALAAVIGGGVGVGSYAFLDHQGGQTIASPITVTTQQAPQQAKVNGTIEAATKVIEPSVVTITVQDGSGGDLGSGVVLDKQGHILTNNHVVAGDTTSSLGGGFPGSQTGQQTPQKITVTFSDGETASAKVVGTDETDDLAVLKVDGVKNLKPATFAKSSSLIVGQSVVAVGAPLGLSQTVTSGIVSNTARPVRSGTNNDAVYMAVQTDAAINPGNSGGPLVDLDGSVIGIDSSIASTSDGSPSGSQSGNIGIGFAIPSNVVVRVASELIANGKSPDAVLGVTISGTDGSELGSTTTGVALDSVAAGSGAAKAGLKAGDVVTQLNGFKVTTADGLIAATHYYAPGTTVTVTYRRGGQTKTVDVTLGTA